MRLNAFDASGVRCRRGSAAGLGGGICLDISAALNVGPISRVEITTLPPRIHRRLYQYRRSCSTSKAANRTATATGCRTTTTTARTSPIPIRPTPTATAWVTCATRTAMATASIRRPPTTARTSPIPIRPTPTATAWATPAMPTTTTTTVARRRDNCPFDPNPDQADADGDGVGDACDADNADARQRRRAGQCRPLRADAPGQVVNAEGCAIAQICPCDKQVEEPRRLRRLRRADGERLPRGRPDQRCASWSGSCSRRASPAAGRGPGTSRAGLKRAGVAPARPTPAVRLPQGERCKRIAIVPLP